jgi:hypothetical protein
VADPAHIDLAFELQRIYDSEINIRIDWLWDGGIDVYLGDVANGYVAYENVQSAAGNGETEKLRQRQRGGGPHHPGGSGALHASAADVAAAMG